MSTTQARFRFNYDPEKAQEILDSIGAVFHKEIASREVLLSADEGNIYRLLKTPMGTYKLMHQETTDLGMRLVRKMRMLPHTQELCDILFADPSRVLHRTQRRYAWERSLVLIMSINENGKFLVIVPDDEDEKKALFTAFQVTEDDVLDKGFSALHEQFTPDSEE